MGRQMRVLGLRSNGVPIKSIYVFGARNSGTNYVNSLVLKNCRSQTGEGLYDAQNRTRFGWKHGFPSMLGAPEDVLAIAVYREPISWLHSLCRAPWHSAKHLRGIPFSQFIRSEWVALIDDEGFGVTKDDPLWNTELLADRDPLTGLRFANAMRMRNAKNIGFASLDNRFGNVLRVNYETVLSAPDVFLNGLRKTFGLTRLAAFDPILHDRATPVRGVFQHKPLPFTSDEDLHFIRSQLDLAGEAALGYSLDTPTFDIPTFEQDGRQAA